MAWYEVSGKDSDVVFSSRIRLARNLSGYPFEEGLTTAAAREILNRIGTALGADFTREDLEGAPALRVQSLVEQHEISPAFAAKKTPHALFTDEKRSLYLMGLEEDHIRLQCLLPGLALSDAYRLAREADRKLAAKLPIAFDREFGYLTHCPTNLGTGLRASVMLFLPALSSGGYMEDLSARLSQIGLTVRGLYGEGSRADGCLYQISNQVTLGVSEESILNKLEESVRSVIKKERALRNAVRGEAAAAREDRICRAEGIARYATRMSAKDFFSLFADLKLGVSLGLVTSLSDTALDALLIKSLPATLSLSGHLSENSAGARDALRAKLIKQTIEGE